MEKTNKLITTVTMAVVIAIGLGGISSTFGTPAFASSNSQVPSVVTIPLEGKSLDKGQFLLISDTTPDHVDRAHIALNVPCKDGSNPESEITVVAGEAPNVKKVNLEFIKQLSDQPKNCTFHADIPDDVKGDSNAKVTDIAIISLNKDIHFNSGNFVTLSVQKVN